MLYAFSIKKNGVMLVVVEDVFASGVDVPMFDAVTYLCIEHWIGRRIAQVVEVAVQRWQARLAVILGREVEYTTAESRGILKVE